MLKIGYSDKRGIFHHPETEKEFVYLLERLTYFKNIDDIQGMFTVAMQLAPNIVDESKKPFEEPTELNDTNIVLREHYHAAGAHSLVNNDLGISIIFNEVKTASSNRKRWLLTTKEGLPVAYISKAITIHKHKDTKFPMYALFE